MKPLIYKDKAYNTQQYMEIAYGIFQCVDVDAYANPDYSSNIMYYARQCMLSGFDDKMHMILNVAYDPVRAEYIYKAIAAGIDTDMIEKYFVDFSCNACPISEILTEHEKMFDLFFRDIMDNYDISAYANSELCFNAMKEISDAMHVGVNPEIFKGITNAGEIRIITFAHLSGVDYSNIIKYGMKHTILSGLLRSLSIGGRLIDHYGDISELMKAINGEDDSFYYAVDVAMLKKLHDVDTKSLIDTDALISNVVKRAAYSGAESSEIDRLSAEIKNAIHTKLEENME